jgi:AcrR family transcriptional regulator
MGRKSRAEERREEILAAFERCIGRDGIDVPLERIADEAGVQRSLIRHYLGNREDVVNQVIARIAAGYPQRVAALLQPALERGRAGVLEVFFESELVSPEWDDVIHAVVSTAQGRYPHAKRQVAAMVGAIVDLLAAALARLYPGATDQAAREVAYGLVCIAQANAELCWLGMSDAYVALARASAEQLLDGLGASEGTGTPLA